MTYINDNSALDNLVREYTQHMKKLKAEKNRHIHEYPSTLLESKLEPSFRINMQPEAFTVDCRSEQMKAFSSQNESANTLKKEFEVFQGKPKTAFYYDSRSDRFK